MCQGNRGIHCILCQPTPLPDEHVDVVQHQDTGREAGGLGRHLRKGGAGLRIRGALYVYRGGRSRYRHVCRSRGDVGVHIEQH